MSIGHQYFSNPLALYELEDSNPERLELVLGWLRHIGAIRPDKPERNTDVLPVLDGTAHHDGDPEAMRNMRDILDLG